MGTECTEWPAYSCYHYAFEGSLRGVVTVGGFAVDTFPGIGGVLCGSTEVVTRNKATPVVPIAVLTAWADEQVQLLSASALMRGGKLKGAAVLMRFGANPQETYPSQRRETSSSMPPKSRLW